VFAAKEPAPRGPNCRIVQLRKTQTLLPQADDPYTWPRFGGAILSGTDLPGTRSPAEASEGFRDWHDTQALPTGERGFFLAPNMATGPLEMRFHPEPHLSPRRFAVRTSTFKSSLKTAAIWMLVTLSSS